MSQYRQKEIDAIKASEAKEYRGKYALAKHETLALRCENLEKQLAEVRELVEDCLIEIKANYDYDYDEFSMLQERFEQLKEKGDEY